MHQDTVCASRSHVYQDRVCMCLGSHPAGHAPLRLFLSHTYLEERYVEAYVIICLQLLPEHLLAALRVQLVFVLHLWAK